MTTLAGKMAAKNNSEPGCGNVNSAKQTSGPKWTAYSGTAQLAGYKANAWVC